MKLQIEKKAILNELKKAQKVIDKKSALPQLQYLKIDIKDNVIKFTSSNSTISLISKLELEDSNHEEESYMVNPQLLISVIKKINTTEVNIQNEEDMIVVKSGKRKFKINTYSDNTYPKIEVSDTYKAFTINSSELSKGLNKVINMVSVQPYRPVLTGVHFKVDALGQLCLESTDSYRLARTNVNVEKEETFEGEIDEVLPKSFLSVLLSSITNESEIVVYKSSNKNYVFKFNNNLFVCRIIDGSYPDLNRLLNGDSEMELKINKSKLLESISCAIFDDGSNGNVIKMKISKDTLTIENGSETLGEFKDELENDFSFNGELNELTFNGEYLSQALKTFDEDEIKMYFKESEMTPFYIKNEDTTQLMFPIRTY